MADKFDESTQKELSVFLEQQQTQAKFHATVHNLTSMCWDKCVTGAPSTSFSRSEESCLQNCVGRFLDSSMYIVKQVERQREQLSLSG